LTVAGRGGIKANHREESHRMLETEPRTQPLVPPPVAPSEPDLVHLTDAAATKLRELAAQEPSPALGLRVYVYSGGCSGFRYGMMLEDQPTPEDVTVRSNGVTVYVDGQSTQYLRGSEIDYVDTLMGAGFTVNNPNAVSACGCGSSFRTAESEGAPGACHH